MLTPWGEALDKNAVLQEYPRPQLVRESYYNLNGLWDYAITASDACPSAWDGKILVPFSPEALRTASARIYHILLTIYHIVCFCTESALLPCTFFRRVLYCQ